jgi:hypothetical protein
VPQQFPDAYWHYEPQVRLECSIEGSVVRIKTLNTNRLNVDLGAGGLGLTGNVKVIVNGKQMYIGPVQTKSLTFSWK